MHGVCREEGSISCAFIIPAPELAADGEVGTLPGWGPLFWGFLPTSKDAPAH